jgi:hypothetical protein
MAIASLSQQNFRIRVIASQHYRSAGTMQLVLVSNSSSSVYANVKALCSLLHCRRKARTIVKLHPDSTLCGMVQQLPRKRWSKPKISETLARFYTKGQELRGQIPDILSNYVQPHEIEVHEFFE